jgi:uncharacterized protein
MLIRFTCENAFCFHREVSLSMVSTSDKRHPNHVSRSSRVGAPGILRAAGIYGANGHGKTKLVRALFFMKQMACADDGEQIRTLSPFKLASDAANQPSRLVLNFRVRSVDYEYGLIIKNDLVEQEWLYESEKRQEVMLFTRERRIKPSNDELYSFEFGAKLRNSKSPSSKVTMDDYLQVIATGTSEEETFLSQASTRKVLRLKACYDWFANTLQVVTADARYGNLHVHAAEDEDFLEYLSSSLCRNDTGIGKLKLKKAELPMEFIDRLPLAGDNEVMDQIRDLKVDEGLRIGPADGPSAIIERKKDGFSFFEFVTVHKADEGDVEFKLEDESSGTRRLMDLFPMMYSLAKGDKVFVVDELDRKLHPLLAYDFVSNFLSQPKGQLIFTTHTTHLLDLDLLRRDEVWLVQKKSDGSSDLYSLSDFKVRPDLDIRKGYLQGRFGGVPFVGDAKALGWC